MTAAALRINTDAKRGRFTIGEHLMVSTTNGSSPFSGGFFGGNPFYDTFSMLLIIPVQDASYVSAVKPGGWGIGSNNAKT